MNSVGRCQSAELMSGGGVCQPGLACANVVADEFNAPHGVKGLGVSQMSGAGAQKRYLMAGFCENLANEPARTAHPNTRFLILLSNLRKPRPMHLCARESGEDILSSWARWSWKERAFSAIIDCSAPEYDTSSTTNDEGNHCEKQEGGCQNSTTCAVQYSSVGSKTDGADPSVMILGGGQCTIVTTLGP